MRRVLPQRRYCETTTIIRNGVTFAVTYGHYENGEVGEVFITGAKAGSDLEAVARDAAVLLSLALQHGVPIETIRNALLKDRTGFADTIIGSVVDRI